jgi:hypothetical protein
LVHRDGRRSAVHAHRVRIYIAAAAVRTVFGEIGMVRFVVFLWAAMFLSFTTFIMFVSFDSPGTALKLAFSDLKSTNGFVVGNCVIGGKFKYKYVVASREYISKDFGPCKQPVADQKELLIYYVESEPEVSWSGSNPKREILFLLVGSAFMSTVGVWAFLVKYR